MSGGESGGSEGGEGGNGEGGESGGGEGGERYVHTYQMLLQTADVALQLALMRGTSLCLHTCSHM